MNRGLVLLVVLKMSALSEVSWAIKIEKKLSNKQDVFSVPFRQDKY